MQSISSDYLKGLRSFAKLFPDLPHGRLLVYAGTESQQRGEATIINVFQLADFLAKLGEG